MNLNRELLFAANPTPMLYYEGTSREILRVNQEFEKRYLPSENVLGHCLDEFCQPLHADMQEALPQVNERSEYLSFQINSGETLLIELISQPAQLNGNQVYLGAIKEWFQPIPLKTDVGHSVFKSVFDKALDMILVADDEGRFVHVNDTACTKLGYSREELLNMRVPDITHGPIKSYGDKKWTDFIRTGVDEGEYWLETKGGSIIYSIYRAVANVQPGMHMSVLRDITPQYQLEREEALKSKAIESSLNGMVFMNAEFELSYANEAFLDMLGYTDKSELEGKCISTVLGEQKQLLPIEKEIEKSGKWAGVIRLIKKNGAVLTVYASLNSFIGDADEPLMWLGSVRDLTEHLESLAALEVSEFKFGRVLEAAPDGILIVGNEGDIEYCNSQAIQMLGYDRNELIGRSVEELIPVALRNKHKSHREKFKRAPQRIKMGGEADLNAVRKDATEFPVDITIGPLEINDKANYVVMIRDMTYYKEAKSRLEREKDFNKLIQHITEISNQTEDIEDALKRSIKRICAFMKWPVGHVYWPANDGSGEFYPTTLWHISEPGKYESFQQSTMRIRFSAGMGMVGKVIESGRPVWFMDALKDPDFVQRLGAANLNIRSCFAFPVTVGTKVVGICEFFSDRVFGGDTHLLEKMATVGHQLGRVVERRDAREKLKKSETKFRTLFDTASDAILLLDRNHLIDCNPRAEKLLGLSKQVLKGESINSFLPTELETKSGCKRKLIRKFLGAYNGENQFDQCRIRRPDGITFEVEISLIPIRLEEESNVQVIIHDITERKKSEQLLSRNVELFGQLFENAPVGVVMLDKSERVVNINRSFKQIFGYDLEEIKSRKLDHFLVSKNKYDEAYKLTEQTLFGDSIQIESVRTTKSGKNIPVLIGTVPVIVKGKTIAIFGMYLDISHRKKMEQELRKSLKEKEVLLKEIHHRVKNNLAVITGLLELQLDQPMEEEVFKKLRDTRARIYSMALVHEQLYQMESYSSIELTDYLMNLSTSIEKAFASSEKQITISFDALPVQISLNKAVPCGLVMNELITNAFKHAFVNRNEGVITLSIHQAGNEVEVQVKDNGIGIPDNVMQMSSKSLGLTLIEALLKQLQGRLEIKNDNGTEFTLTFPID